MALDILQLKRSVLIVGRDDIGEPLLVSVSVKTVLRSICSVSEAATCWQKDYTHIQRLAKRGILSSEKMGGQWMICTQDLVKRWGEPIIKLEDLRNVE